MTYPKLATSVLGVVLIFAGTALHPMSEPPNDAARAFAEYASDRWWLVSHLLQLAGFAVIVPAVVLVGMDERWTAGRAWARSSAVLAIAGLALMGALQAVDGIALKAMANRLLIADPATRPAIFAATLAVRHIEIGLAGISSLVLGAAVALFGAAQIVSQRVKTWIGLLGTAAGGAVAAGGIAMAATGFSDLAMTVNAISLPVFAVWLVLTMYAADRDVRAGVAREDNHH